VARSRRPAGRRWQLAAVAVAVALGAGCGRERPNVVLVSLDTLRADRLSCQGAERPTSPVIDRLAARGVRFANAFSPAPWTLPAHAAMLAGRYPGSLSPHRDETRLFARAPQLSAMLREAGWATGAVTGGGFLRARWGADLGFDTFVEGDVQAAVRWIEAHAGGGPFFLFFHTYEVHTPYTDRRFADGMPGGRLVNIFRDDDSLYQAVCCRGMDATAQERAFLLALYDGGVARADEMVGALVAALDRTGVAGRTIVIVTSDHGEEFWEHLDRAAQHGQSLYDELLRVPLVWSGPGLAPGTVVEDPVSLVDIVPTVLALAGVPVPPGLDGIDLTPALRGHGGLPDRAILAEWPRSGPGKVAVRTRTAKLIEPVPPFGPWVQTRPVRVPNRRELYLASDVGERHDVAAAHPRIAAALLARIADRRRLTATAAAPTPPGKLDPTTRAQLRALGYVDE
jgi:arylsulfatase A-like enzyme